MSGLSGRCRILCVALALTPAFLVTATSAADGQEQIAADAEQLIAKATEKMAKERKALIEKLIELKARTAHLARDTDQIRKSYHALEKYRQLHDRWLRLDVWTSVLRELGDEKHLLLCDDAAEIWKVYNKGINDDLAADRKYTAMLQELSEKTQEMQELSMKLAKPVTSDKK